jgi:hypothetical protein
MSPCSAATVVDALVGCDHDGVTMRVSDDSSKEPRRLKLVLRRPSHVEHPENIDLAAAIEILNSPELGEEIWAANNYDPDLEA